MTADVDVTLDLPEGSPKTVVDLGVARLGGVKTTVTPAAGAGDEPPPNGGRRNLGAYGGTAQASRSRR